MKTVDTIEVNQNSPEAVRRYFFKISDLTQVKRWASDNLDSEDYFINEDNYFIVGGSNYVFSIILKNDIDVLLFKLNWEFNG